MKFVEKRRRQKHRLDVGLSDRRHVQVNGFVEIIHISGQRIDDQISENAADNQIAGKIPAADVPVDEGFFGLIPFFGGDDGIFFGVEITAGSGFEGDHGRGLSFKDGFSDFVHNFEVYFVDVGLDGDRLRIVFHDGGAGAKRCRKNTDD